VTKFLINKELFTNKDVEVKPRGIIGTLLVNIMGFRNVPPPEPKVMVYSKYLKVK